MPPKPNHNDYLPNSQNMRPLPSTPVPFQNIANYQDRGSIWFEPQSSSTLSKLSKYTVQDDCDRDAYIKLSQSASINDVINCQTIQDASVSLSLTLPHNATEEDFDLVITWISSRMKADAGLPAN